MTLFGITLSNADLFLLTIAGSLAVFILTSSLYRTNAAIIKRREQKGELIGNLLTPFNDAIVKIEHGEHNHIMILNTFHESQQESVSKAKALARQKDKAKIQAAWDSLDTLYQQVGEERVIWQFAAFTPDVEERQMAILRNHIDVIVKAIKRI